MGKSCLVAFLQVPNPQPCQRRPPLSPLRFTPSPPYPGHSAQRRKTSASIVLPRQDGDSQPEGGSSSGGRGSYLGARCCVYRKPYDEVVCVSCGKGEADRCPLVVDTDLRDVAISEA